jgi:DNA-binding NtrC family response regulator
MPMASVLLAIPNAWRIEINNHLTREKFKVIEAALYEQALALINDQQYEAIIVVLQWAVNGNAELTQLWNSIRQNIPVLVLVPSGTNYSWFNKVYKPPLHSYCTIPIDPDEIDSFLKINGLLV